MKTPVKQGPNDIRVNLPRESIQKPRRISRLAGVTLDQLVSVIIATKIVNDERGGRP